MGGPGRGAARPVEYGRSAQWFALASPAQAALAFALAWAARFLLAYWFPPMFLNLGAKKGRFKAAYQQIETPAGCWDDAPSRYEIICR